MILFLISVIFLGIEFYLRSLTNPDVKPLGRILRRESARFDDFDVIKSIPPHKNAAYLTPEFWKEMQFFTNQGSAEKIKTPQGHLVVNAKNFDGKHISARDGMRTTTDTPDNPTGRVLLLGGSTVYCFEVPDSLTIASYLQRALNSTGLTLKVLNLGVSGVTAISRIEKLHSMGTLTNKDVVIVLFGDNDVGWQNYYAQESLLLKVLRNLREYSRLLAWAYFELSTPRRRKVSVTTSRVCADRLKEFSLHLNSLGVRHKFVLQPNVYTKKHLNEYESEIVQRFGVDFAQIIRSGYSIYEQLQGDSFTSATNLMDNTSDSVYLDWSHTNAMGNELVAKFILELEIFKNVENY